MKHIYIINYKALKLIWQWNKYIIVKNKTPVKLIILENNFFDELDSWLNSKNHSK